MAMEEASKSKRGGKRKVVESEASPQAKKKRSKKKKITSSSSQHPEEDIPQEKPIPTEEEEEEVPHNDDESHHDEDDTPKSPPPTPKRVPTPTHQQSPPPSPLPQSPIHKTPPRTPSPIQALQPSSPQKSPPHQSNPPSPSHSEDFIYGDDDEELTGFVASSFKFSLDDDEPTSSMSSAQFSSLNEKLDTLLTSSIFQNSQQWESVLTANTKVLQDSAKLVAESEKALLDTTAKFDKLNTDVRDFMDTFQVVFQSNTENVNKMIANFGEALKKEKKALAEVREDLKNEHAEMITDVTSRIEKLQSDLSLEANLMDALAEKTSKLTNKALLVRVLREKLDNLTSEKTVFTSSLSEVISYLTKVLDTNDSVLTPSVRHHLTDKLTPAILLLKQLVSVSEIGSISKQGGEEDPKEKKHDDDDGSDARKEASRN